MSRRPLAAAICFLVLVGAAGCSDDDSSESTGDGGASTTATTTAGGSETTVAGADPADPSDPGEAGTDTTGGDPDDPADLDDPGAADDPGDDPVVEGACALMPPGTTVDVLGELPAGVAGGDDRRQVCTITAGESGGVGLTLAREAGDRFDDKVAASQNALGVDGEDVPGLGDRARFFFSDADIPEGVGGVVFVSGDTTVDITLQGLDEADLRAASLSLAAVAAGNL